MNHCVSSKSFFYTSCTVSSGGSGLLAVAVSAAMIESIGAGAFVVAAVAAVSTTSSLLALALSRDAARCTRRFPFFDQVPAAVMVKNMGGLCLAASCSLRFFINWFDLFFDN